MNLKESSCIIPRNENKLIYMKQQKAKYVCNYALMSVTRSPRPPIAQKFQCFSLPEHNKEQRAVTPTLAHISIAWLEIMKFCCYCTIVAYIAATEDLFRSLLVLQLPCTIFVPFPRQRMHL